MDGELTYGTGLDLFVVVLGVKADDGCVVKIHLVVVWRVVGVLEGVGVRLVADLCGGDIGVVHLALV